MSDVLEAPVEAPVNTDDPNKVQHYFSKADIEANTFEGKPMTALCGYVKDGPQQDPKGLPVCQECKRVYDDVLGINLPNRGDD